MRILVISRSAWRNDNSTGNTLTDFFSDLPQDVYVYSLCMREQPPQNNIAKRHFCISEHQMLGHLFDKKAEVGAENTAESAVDTNENAIYEAAKKRPSYLLYALREVLWDIGGWKNENLQRYIRDIQPDIVFFPTFGHYYPHKILRYLHTLTNARIVLFHADDHYTLRQFSLSPLYWLYRFGLRRWMRRTVRIADRQYCISDIQKADYEKAFGRECNVLTKFAEFDKEPSFRMNYQKPLQLVFTGNINNNRWKSLAMLARVLQRINDGACKAQLRIYTATPVTRAMKKALEIDGVSYLMGSVPSAEIPRLQREADLLVHAEATDLKNRLLVRQSFSTKIVDYFKAARPIVAVGPKDVASIRHLIDHDCAVTADHEQELYEKLTAVMDDEKAHRRLAANAWQCGRTCHNKTDVQTRFQEDLQSLI